MNTTYKPYTISELIDTIYEDNLNHFQYIEQMANNDCDCRLHTTIGVIYEYGGI